jgi:hypothetical protein
MENNRYRHDTLVGGYSFYFFPVLAFFWGGKMKNIS